MNRFLILLSFLGLTAPFAIGAAPGQLDPQLANIAHSIKAQDYTGGLHTVDRQLTRDPHNALLLRLKGICLLKENKFNEAVVVLRQALVLDSESTATRYYLAQALAEQGRILESVALLERVQKDAPDSEYARLAAAVLPQLRTLAQTAQELPPDAGSEPAPRRFSVNLRLATEYDDNVPLRATGDGGPGKQDSFVLATSENFEVRPLDQKIDAAPLTLGLGYTGYQSLHDRTELRIFDIIQHTGFLYLAHSDEIDHMPVNARIGAGFEYTDLDDSLYSRAFTANASFSIQPANWTSLALHYDAARQDFSFDSDQPDQFGRDGLDQQVGLTEFFYLFHNNVILSVGYTHHFDSTDGAQFNLNSHIITTSAQISLPANFTLRAFGQYENADYIDFSPAPERLDNIYTGTVSISHPLFTPDFVGEIAYTHSTANSEADFAKYHRNIISFSVSYNY